MNWLENMNHAMDYIEDNLEGKIDYEKLAQAACSSVYHFQRIFSYMADVSLSEYIRRRKMSQAAFDLQNSRIKIVDLAAKYGYDSPESFTRAFQNLHGIPPTEARKSGANLKAYPRLTFQIIIKGVEKMNYKIVEKEAFQVYGIERIFDTKDSKQLIEIPQFWQEIMQNKDCEKLLKSAYYPTRLNAICGYHPLNGTTLPYLIFALKTPLSDTTGYTTIDVPASTWAIFANQPHPMSETTAEVQKLVSQVYTEWLPSSNYDIVPGYDMEMYFSTMDEKYYEEIWFRVTPQK